MKLNESVWRAAEANMAARTRQRLIASGIVRLTSVPNILVKGTNGDWEFPQIQTKGSQ